MDNHLKIAECELYANENVIRNQDEYFWHIDKVRDIMVNGNTDNSYPTTTWLYAIEAWELKTNTPTRIPSIYQDVQKNP